MVENIVAPSTSSKVDGAFFSDCATDYSRVNGLVDALVRSENPESDIALAQDVIARLNVMATSGKGYTPDKSLGFGSDNSATIADKILGRSPTAAQVRKKFRLIGRDA